MENINIQLKKKIMRRVYFSYFLQRVFNSFTLKAYALVFFAGVIVSQVSMTNVLANMPRLTEVNALYRFSASAFLNTEFIIQILSVGALIVIFLLLKDITKTYLTATPITV